MKSFHICQREGAVSRAAESCVESATRAAFCFLLINYVVHGAGAAAEEGSGTSHASFLPTPQLHLLK